MHRPSTMLNNLLNPVPVVAFFQFSLYNKYNCKILKFISGENGIRVKHIDKIMQEFDGVREIVYLADMQDHTLLFINKAGVEAFGIGGREEAVGKKCYEVLQGHDFPCTYCTNGQLCTDVYLEWVNDNPVTGRSYRFKDKRIEWEGRSMRIGIGEELDNAGIQSMRDELKRKSEREQIVIECIKRMYSSPETDQAIHDTLEIVGRYLRCERAYIFRIHNTLMNNTHEWCAEGVSREIDSLQMVPVSLIDRWIPYFDRDECVIIQDVEQIRESAPEEYAVLKLQNIHSLITVPLVENGTLAGYYGVDNPLAGNLNEISNILNMLAYFFQSLFERKRREDYLKLIGYTDGLTGALNRNAYLRDTLSDVNRNLTSAGGFFIDINGLKKTNDTYGHEAGDQLIRQVYQIVRSAAQDYPVYRLGGDEFVILCPDITRDNLELLESRLRTQLDGRNKCSAAIGVTFQENPSDLGVLVEAADQKMYRDKEEYYKNRS